MLRPKWEVADILKIGYPQLVGASQLPYVVQKAAHDIIQCRTAVLGGHVSACSSCHHREVSYNSCRNRHCPKCQYSKQEQWILDRESDVLPVRYFHVVFTVPHELNAMTMAFPRIMYGLLFKAAWKTIKTLGFDRKWLGAQTGMTALLHTWGQNLSFHPHLHCIIPGGGFVREIERWIYLKHRKFLFPVRVISKLYKRYYIELLKQEIGSKRINWECDEWSVCLRKLKSSSFNVYSKSPFAGPDQVIKYLGRYTHRVAISNHRIRKVTNSEVSFVYTDYRDGGQKQMQLSVREFTRRFLQHILPHRFAKIRHYGFLSNKVKCKSITAILSYLERKRRRRQKFDVLLHFQTRFGIKLDACPKCKTGKLIRMAELPDVRGDPSNQFIKIRPKNIVIKF